MTEELIEKFNEISVEYRVIEFVAKFSDAVGTPYAFTGGIAFGGYLGHLPRRSSDIDMVTSAAGFSEIKRFLVSEGFVDKTDSAIIRQFASEEFYFDLDIHVDYLYLGLPPAWEILGKFSLKEALENRVSVSVRSMDQKKSARFYAIPPEYHFLLKLFPPVETSNMHDLLYLIATCKDADAMAISVRDLINRYAPFEDYFLQRLKMYKQIAPSTIWFRSLDSAMRERVTRFIATLV